MSITTLIDFSIDCHNGQLKKNASFETVGYPIAKAENIAEKKLTFLYLVAWSKTKPQQMRDRMRLIYCYDWNQLR